MAANRRPSDLEDMARLTEEQRICAVEEMVKTRSLVGTRRKLKTTFGIEVSTRALQKLRNKWKKTRNSERSPQKNLWETQISPNRRKNQ